MKNIIYILFGLCLCQLSCGMKQNDLFNDVSKLPPLHEIGRQTTFCQSKRCVGNAKSKDAKASEQKPFLKISSLISTLPAGQLLGPQFISSKKNIISKSQKNEKTPHMQSLNFTQKEIDYNDFLAREMLEPQQLDPSQNDVESNYGFDSIVCKNLKLNKQQKTPYPSSIFVDGIFG